MMYHNYRFTLFTEFSKQFYNGAFSDRVNSLKWFVHKINPGILYQRAGQKSPLLLPAG